MVGVFQKKKRKKNPLIQWFDGPLHSEANFSQTAQKREKKYSCFIKFPSETWSKEMLF